MTRSELAAYVARIERVDPAIVRRIQDRTFQAIGIQLGKGLIVTLRGFGTFLTRQTKAHFAVLQGKRMFVQPPMRPRFKPSKVLIAKLNSTLHASRCTPHATVPITDRKA